MGVGSQTEGRRIRIGATLLLCGFTVVQLGRGIELEGAARYAGGAPPAFTGGFGEMACDACHFDHLLNPPGGSLAIEGAPEWFTPGESYPIVVTLVRPGMKVGGFQLSARFVEGGGQAGAVSFAEGERDDLAVEMKGGIQYLHQTDPGSRVVVADTARWDFLWTAPSDGGTVIFHASGNAADGDGSTAGDFVYTATAESTIPQP